MAFDLIDAKTVLLKRASILCTDKLNEVIKLYPDGESETWAEQVRLSALWIAMSDAEKIAALSNIQLATLFCLAVGTYAPTESNIPFISDLANKITQNKTLFGVYSGLVLNLKNNLATAINAATNESELNAVSVDYSAISLAAIYAALTGG